MKKMLLTKVVLLMFYIGQSQEKIDYISDLEIDEKTSTLAKEEKYDLILEMLNKVSVNDSTYNNKLVSKSYYLMKLKKYSEALEVLEEGILRGDESNKHSYYINKSICYLNLKEEKKAIETLDLAINKFPMNSELYYRKASIFYDKKDNKTALKLYKEALKRNPFDANIHLKMGNICLTQHLTTQALMCFNMYLLLNPEGDNAFAVLNSLNGVLSKDNTQKKIKGLTVSKDDENFEDLDLILDSRISLSEKYKISNPINVAFTKQNQVLLEKLNEFEGSGGFWDTRYVPFYKWVFENNFFDSFIYTTTFSIKNEKYKKIVEKKIKEINEFIPLFMDKWEKLMMNNKWERDGEMIALSTNFYERKVEGLGQIKEGNLIGAWAFFDKMGRPSSNGSFNAKGKRIGTWEWKYKNGNTKETSSYKNGVLEGVYIGYYKNKKLKYKAFYVNDTLNGPYQYYSNKGVVTQDKNFVKGKLEGKYMAFHEVGRKAPKYILNFKNGLQEGEFIEKSPEGNDIYKVLKVNGEKEGIETSFYNSGIVESITEYKEGLYDGKYESYFKNGKIKRKGIGLEGKNSGVWNTYYSDGKLHEKNNYDKGELTGANLEYAANNILLNEFKYRKGELIGYTFFNKKGKVIKEAKKKGGKFFYEGHSINGSITTEGLYNVKGGKQGIWKFFTDNGVLNSVGNYKDGKADGESIDYHGNGQIKTKCFYKNDTVQGYQSEYYENGVMSSQGNVNKGEFDKEWRSYYKDGTLYAINYYHKGKFHGTQKFYSIEGELVQVKKYIYGDLVFEELYGKDTKILATINYEDLEGEKVIEIPHSNGKTHKKLTYVNGQLHGPYTVYNYYGDMVVKGAYINGKAAKKWEWYYKDGKLHVSINYLGGSRHGSGSRYYKTGKLKEQKEYNLGNLMSLISYAEDGETIIGQRTLFEEGGHGKRYDYSKNGKLGLIRVYELGKLIGYSYHDKNGVELPMIPIEKETAKIVSYFDNGKKARSIEYVNGVLENEDKEYYYSGKLFYEKHFKLGSYDGISIEYYENGKVKKEVGYNTDDYSGPRKQFYSNGQLKELINYKNDEKFGKAKYYSKKGKLLKTEYYFNNTIINVED